MKKGNRELTEKERGQLTFLALRGMGYKESEERNGEWGHPKDLIAVLPPRVPVRIGVGGKGNDNRRLFDAFMDKFIEAQKHLMDGGHVGGCPKFFKPWKSGKVTEEVST